ncbi:thermonuclease family protein [Oricola thermophila]|uniref:Thermonuclease family protein n=1 Tax=Oricola thermophila TaxID=2742145 RepID=A0A6N1VEC1_9HYPH|nr:hypothetical protein [Oricola thermophila]QKV19311.1 hypothetical protein HTY61_13010 [Oricola thermophila]
MKRRTALAITGAVLAATVLAGGAVAGDRDYVLLSHPEAIDGRSFIDGSGAKYRLHAVIAPRVDQECKGVGGEPYACGEQSRDALARMIDGILTCDLVGRDDGEWQSVRCFDFAGRDIASRLIALGWALPDRSVGTLDYVMDELEAEAGRLGLWQNGFVDPSRWRAGVRL